MQVAIFKDHAILIYAHSLQAKIAFNKLGCRRNEIETTLCISCLREKDSMFTNHAQYRAGAAYAFSNNIN